VAGSNNRQFGHISWISTVLIADFGPNRLRLSGGRGTIVVGDRRPIRSAGLKQQGATNMTYKSRNTYSVEEASRILGISRSHAYKVVGTGELPSISLGDRILIPKPAVDQLLSPTANPSRINKNSRNDNYPFEIEVERYREISGEYRRNRNTGPVTIDLNAKRQDREC